MDSVGRLGGDEFAILAPATGESGAERIATRARKLLSERVAVSTGTAAFPAHGADQDELQRHADRELYANKHGDSAHFTAGRRELTWAATLARAVDARMATPVEHSTIVARYAAGIAARLGWSGEDLAHMRIAAMLHDIGKVTLPDRILQKPDSLDAREYEEVKRHPEEDAELIDRVEGGRDRRQGPPLPRALRRVGVPGRACRRRDPTRLPDPVGGGRLRRDHE